RWHSPTTGRAARGGVRSSSALAQRLEKRGENLRRGGGDVAGLQVALLALQVGHQSARFLDKQRPRRHVPGREPELPERIQPAAGDIGKIERRGARAPYAGAGLHHRRELARVELEARHFLERKAGADQRIAEVR